VTPVGRPFQKQFDANPGDRYGHRVIVREIERDVRGQRRVVVLCDLCGDEQVTRFHVLREGAAACLACANQGFQTMEERFWDKAFPEPNSGCWLWTGVVDGAGYAMFMRKGKLVRASRFSFELAGTPVPKGKVVCHRCDNPICVAPPHLYVGTHKSNADDRTMRNRDGGPLRRGDGNGRAVLTWELVQEIRAKWALNMPGRKPLHTKRSLSREYKVSDVQIGHIVTGRQWQVK
jgi:hypothetical protein